jgi:tricarballylate dehydrogenase
MANGTNSDGRAVDDYDVVVVGHGVSGLSAGIAAHERGAETLIIEKSPREKRGGHTRHAGGIFRFPMPDPQQTKEDFDLDETPEKYTEQDFMDDLMQVSDGNADPELCEVLVENAYEAIQWITDHGVSWHVVDTSDEPGFGSVVGGIQSDGEGKGVVESLAPRVEELGIDVRYRTECRGLVTDESNAVVGVEAVDPDGKVTFAADGVVICAGSYVSNPEKRTRYFGRDGDRYVVRGSRYNTGEALDAALDAGAMAEGQWGGAHQVMNDATAARVEEGRARINGYQFGVITNTNGERFVDEGEDFLLKTYAKFGQAVYDQPDQKGFVFFDSKVDHLVVSQIETEPVEGDTLEGLVAKLDMDDPDAAVETLERYNEAATESEDFDPHSLDGVATEGIDPQKTNWARPLSEPPFKCFPVTCGITFAFGGLKIDTGSRVQNTRDEPMAGLWAVGNSSSGFFHGNYPGGSALTRGATFGRRAGYAAADRALGTAEAEAASDD